MHFFSSQFMFPVDGVALGVYIRCPITVQILVCACVYEKDYMLCMGLCVPLAANAMKGMTSLCFTHFQTKTDGRSDSNRIDD